MKYHELNAAPNKAKKRVGRGISAGQGKTAGRGTKGQGSRTGKKISAVFSSSKSRHFLQAVPKNKGFKSLRVPAQVVYLDRLNDVKGKTADNASLYEAGLIATPYHNVKIISRGELTKALTVKTQGASKSAVEAIQKAGGTFEATDLAMPKSQKSDKKK